jgi:hypothetical protein
MSQCIFFFLLLISYKLFQILNYRSFCSKYQVVKNLEYVLMYLAIELCRCA